MTDRYRTFADLAANEKLGIDYRIRIVDRGAPFVILAPHGGWIEPGTSEIAQAIAGTDLSFYAFEAMRDGPHGDFHITSHHFDEPEAIDLVGKCKTAVAVHGRQNKGGEAVWMGVRAATLRDAISDSLRRAGFEAEPNKRLSGRDRANICNRTLSGEGVQLELLRSLRRRLASETYLMLAFCQAVRNAIQLSPNT